ncbi:MAG: DUF29 domain-containing protein [Bdellovibrio bacteriovorus]
MQTPLYDQDLYAWAMETARLVRESRFAEIDSVHLAEELESMVKAEQRALESRLEALLTDLLKWEHQPQQRTKSWQRGVIEQRKRIARLLGDSSGLHPGLPETLADAYDSAVRWAADDTGLDEADFPQTCPYPGARVLDSGFYPE